LTPIFDSTRNIGAIKREKIKERSGFLAIEKDGFVFGGGILIALRNE